MRGRARILVAAALLLALSLSMAAAAGPATRVAAHRGGAALWPENSLMAFRSALALGVDALELDLHLTADGEVVVIHDPTLERTSTGSGAIRDLALADLAATTRLKTRDGATTAERVPTFAQVLDLAAPSAIELLPEIKVDGNRRRYDGIEEKVLALVRSRGLLARTTTRRSSPRRSAACASSSRRRARCCWWLAATSSATARDRPRRCGAPASSARPTSE